MKSSLFYKLFLFYLIIIVPFIFLIPTAFAIDISFSDFGLTSQDIDIYYSNGTLFDSIRSNETTTLNNTFDYQFVFRPQKLSIIDSPKTFFRMLVSEGFLRVLISIFVLAGLYQILAPKSKRIWRR